MDGNDEQQIQHYYDAENLLKQAGILTQEIATRRISGSQVEPTHLRITHLEQQAIGYALLAGIRLPARTSDAGPEIASNEKIDKFLDRHDNRKDDHVLEEY